MNARTGWVITMAAFFAALALPVSLGLTPDASWLLTVAERVLNGEALYRDILEYNPPFSIWLYTLPAVASHLSGLPSEAFLYVQFGVIFWLAFALTAAILIAGGVIRREHLWIAALGWVALFVLLPLRTFLQREHLATMILMPWLALQAVRWAQPHSFAPRRWMVVAGGISCAVIAMTKPFYILTVVVPVVGLAVRQRSIRPLFHVENLIGAALAIAYGGAVLLVYPDYFGPLYETLKTTYLPVRTPEADVFFRLCAATIVAAMLLWRTPRRWPAETTILVLAAAGHIAGTVVMGKTYTYHALPAMILLGFAGLWLLADATRSGAIRPPGERLSLLRGTAAALLMGGAFTLTALVFIRGEAPDRDLLAYLRDRHAGASFISVSPSFADSHPLVRLAGGSYLGPHGAMLAESYGAILIEQNPGMDDEQRVEIRGEQEKERRAYAMAILNRQPDVVLVSDCLTHGSWPAWPEISGMSSDGVTVGEMYAEEARIGSILIFVRRKEPGQARAS
ncbi:MAG: hypothetical protein WAU86_02350 [Oricola sp.]